MSVLFHCPRCHAALKAPEHLGGIAGYCPECGGTLLFPGQRVLSTEEERALLPHERTASRQGLRERLRPRSTQSWVFSLALHTAAVLALGLVTWQTSTPSAEVERRVNILLETGEGEMGLQFRPPQDLQVQTPEEHENPSEETAPEHPPARLIEVGPPPTRSCLLPAELRFDTSPLASTFSSTFMGLGARGRSFVFVVDKSGSMGVQQRLEAAKAELAASIRALPRPARFHVIFYDDPDYIEMPSDHLVPASRANKELCYRKMAQVSAGGGTDPTRALLKAFKLKPDVIFLLTDGELKPRTEADRFAELVHLMNQRHTGGRTTVHTIAFISDLGERLLRSIAALNGGSYRYVSESAARRLRMGPLPR